VRTICYRDAAGRHAYAYGERQSRGCYVSQTDNNNDHHANDDSHNDDQDDDAHNDDDFHNDDENDINDSHNDDHVDDHDVFLSGSVDFDKDTRDEPPSDGSDWAIGHDDRFDGLDEIVSAQLRIKRALENPGCSTRNRNLLGCPC
jgi:hypothetical protein